MESSYYCSFCYFFIAFANEEAKPLEAELLPVTTFRKNFNRIKFSLFGIAVSSVAGNFNKEGES